MRQVRRREASQGYVMSGVSQDHLRMMHRLQLSVPLPGASHRNRWLGTALSKVANALIGGSRCSGDIFVKNLASYDTA